jgi:tetratricopeptide (TPR) repeat protein
MLRRLLCTIAATFIAQAGAADFGYLPAGTPQQKDVQTQLTSGNFRQALKSWSAAFQGSTFASSYNGIATWNYLLYKNGLPYIALESLMTSTQPERLDPQLLKTWSAEIKTSAWIQKGWISTLGNWKMVADNSAASLRLRTAKDVAESFKRADKLAPQDVNLKARIWWQIATQAPQINDTASALKAVKLLRDSGQTVYGIDQVAMTQGRVLYQKGDLDAAIAAYREVPKASSFWVESVEERAWANLRKDDYDKALGDITTALSPVLAPLAGPETYFLAHLLSYRVCDYNRLFENSETFKTNHRQRLLDIQDLANKGRNRATEQVFASFDKSGVSQESAGPEVASVPRHLFRDREFVKDMESRRELLSEARTAEQLVKDVPSPILQQAITDNRSKSERLKQSAVKRQQALARIDLKEYRVVLNKMNIIEGEVIQRLNLDDNLKGQRSKLSKVDNSANTMVFPYTKEVWIDELDNYKARVKDCPTLKGASL